MRIIKQFNKDSGNIEAMLLYSSEHDYSFRCWYRGQELAPVISPTGLVIFSTLGRLNDLSNLGYSKMDTWFFSLPWIQAFLNRSAYFTEPPELEFHLLTTLNGILKKPLAYPPVVVV